MFFVSDDGLDCVWQKDYVLYGCRWLVRSQSRQAQYCMNGIGPVDEGRGGRALVLVWNSVTIGNCIIGHYTGNDVVDFCSSQRAMTIFDVVFIWNIVGWFIEMLEKYFDCCWHNIIKGAVHGMHFKLCYWQILFFFFFF